jgi:hypothetical protein
MIKTRVLLEDVHRPGSRTTATFTYEAENPYVVKLAIWDNNFGGGEHEVVWEFARDLLAAGTQTLAGIGDVCIWPSEDRPDVLITLWSPSGSITLRTPRLPVVYFVCRTYMLVPRGAEKIDVDTDIARLLA